MWEQPQIENHVIGPRAAHSCDFYKNMLYLFGGWNGKKALNDLWALNLDTLTWTSVVPGGSSPTQRNNHASIIVGTKLYIHGGHDGTKWLNDFYALDLVSNIWSIVDTSGTPPTARACHTVSRIKQKLFFFGGYDGSKCFNTLDVLDLDTCTWMQPNVRGSIPSPRNAHSMTVHKHKLIMFGGHSGSKHLRDFYTFDTNTLTWDQVTKYHGPFPPGLRGHSANLVGNKIYIAFGYDGRGRSNEVYALDVEHNSWERPVVGSFNQEAPTGRQRHTACLVGTKLYIIGGFDGFKWLQDMHVLDIGRLEVAELTSASRCRLVSSYRSMLNNPESYSDITFIVDSKPIYAHKGIIAAQSEHFRAMFGSGMKESFSQEIVIPEWGFSTFLNMLEYLYTGVVEELDVESAINLIALADHYSLMGLFALCESTLLHCINIENACMILTQAHHYQVLSLKKNSLTYVINNFEDIMHTASFESLQEEPDLLMEVTLTAMGNKR